MNRKTKTPEVKTLLDVLVLLALATAAACGPSNPCADSLGNCCSEVGASTSVASLAPLADAGVLDSSWTCQQACFAASELGTAKVDSCQTVAGYYQTPTGTDTTVDAGPHLVCGEGGTAYGLDALRDAGIDADLSQPCLSACTQMNLHEQLALFGSSDGYSACAFTSGNDGQPAVSCTVPAGMNCQGPGAGIPAF